MRDLTLSEISDVSGAGTGSDIGKNLGSSLGAAIDAITQVSNNGTAPAKSFVPALSEIGEGLGGLVENFVSGNLVGSVTQLIHGVGDLISAFK